MLAATYVTQQYIEHIVCFHGNAFTVYYVIDSDVCMSAIQRERIIACSWQHWLRERAPVLQNTYIPYLVSTVTFNVVCLVKHNKVGAVLHHVTKRRRLKWGSLYQVLR
jgi:hypothetical protein